MALIIAVPAGSDDIQYRDLPTLAVSREMLACTFQKADLIQGEFVVGCKLLGIVLPHLCATIETAAQLNVERALAGGI